MIQIVNIGGNPLGVSIYELRINNDFICTFEHDRRKGLAVCLTEAGTAYAKFMWEQSIKEIKAEKEEVVE